MPATVQGLPESVRTGDARAVAAWLEGGGGVDADDSGVTLLMTAAIRGQEATVRLLLRRGASVPARFRGGSPGALGFTARARSRLAPSRPRRRARADLPRGRLRSPPCYDMLRSAVL